MNVTFAVLSLPRLTEKAISIYRCGCEIEQLGFHRTVSAVTQKVLNATDKKRLPCDDDFFDDDDKIVTYANVMAALALSPRLVFYATPDNEVCN